MNMTWEQFVLLSLSKKRPKNIFPDTGGAGYWWLSLCAVVPAAFYWSIFLGHPVCSKDFLNPFFCPVPNSHDQIGCKTKIGKTVCYPLNMIEMYMNWNTLHKHQLNCCGTQEYKDWVNTTYSSGHIDMLIFFKSFFCLQRLVWQWLIPLTFCSTTELGENVPDSCCLSTVIGCGLGVLSLSEEEVPFYCSCIFSHSFLVNFFSSPS